MPDQIPLIHVGFYKTASTWMQKFLFQPEYGFEVALSHVQVQLGIIDPRPFRFDPDAVLHAYGGNRGKFVASSTPVITAEALSGAILNGGYDARQNADRLKACFPRAKVLLITREQKSLIRSMYKTMVVWGMPHGIKRMLGDNSSPAGQGFHVDFLRFHLIARHYVRLYGEENVLVLPYEMFKQSPGKFLEKIVQHCDLNRASIVNNRPPVGRHLNKSTSLSSITYQRWVNKISANFSASSDRLSDERVKQVLHRMRRFPKIPYLDAYLERRFSDIVVEKTRGQFAVSNKQLQALAGVNLSRYGYDLPEA